jgi:hypothetical protein
MSRKVKQIYIPVEMSKEPVFTIIANINGVDKILVMI